MPFAQRIVVGGPPRTGSTLLRFLLGSIPGVIGGPETTFLYRPFNLVKSKPAPVIERVARVLDLVPAIVEKAIETSYCELEAFDKIMSAYADSLGEHPTVWVEKTPWNCFSYFLLATTSMEVRFISIIRDGRDIVTSESYTGGYHCSVQRYVDSMRVVLAFNDTRHLIVRYEDLVADAEGALRRICAHCGMTYDPIALTAWRDDHPSRSSRKVHQPKLEKELSKEWVGRWVLPEHRNRMREFDGHPDARRLLAASGYV